MTTDLDSSVITTPGAYTIPEDQYYADPIPGRSLSVSGAKKLLPPSCPALYRYERDHGQPHKRVFDFGHAAHSQVLGTGAPLAVIDAPDWRTKAAKEQQQAAYDAGHVPILTSEKAQVDAMAEAIRQHPIASALFHPDSGKPEQSLFRLDEQTGIWLRARLDWLPNPVDKRMIVADYKTCASAEPRAVAKAVADYGYHMQAAFYMDMVRELGLADDVGFVFVMQEKRPPHLITIAEPDAATLRIGRHLNRQAIDLYAQCAATDTWPGYTDDVELISLPPWVANQYPELS